MFSERGLYFIMFCPISWLDFKEKRIKYKVTTGEGFKINWKIFCVGGEKSGAALVFAFELQIR